MSTRYDVIPATEALVRSVANHLRDRDLDDVASYTEIDAAEAVVKSFHASTHSWVGTIDGAPVCAFGVLSDPRQPLSDLAFPWFRGTTRIKGHETAVLRIGRRVLDGILGKYGHLRNVVDASARDTIRWLEWMGFTVEPAIVYLPPYGDQPFRRYFIRRTL